MAETDAHRNQMIDALLHPLQERYRRRNDVYVSGNLLLYYEEGNPAASVAPDVFVVFGIPQRERRIYKLWEEGKAPDVVFELSSRATSNQDLSHKRLLYEALGVTEYFIIDPLGEYLKPPLQGFRLIEEGYYRPLMPTPIGNQNWELASDVLKLFLRAEGNQLRLYDPEQTQYLLTRPEEAEARRQAEARATAAETRAAALEAELARLRKAQKP